MHGAYNVKSIIRVFYMFRSSRVHHKEGHLYISFLRYVFHAEINSKILYKLSNYKTLNP